MYVSPPYVGAHYNIISQNICALRSKPPAVTQVFSICCYCTAGTFYMAWQYYCISHG